MVAIVVIVNITITAKWIKQVLAGEKVKDDDGNMFAIYEVGQSASVCVVVRRATMEDY